MPSSAPLDSPAVSATPAPFPTDHDTPPPAPAPTAKPVSSRTPLAIAGYLAVLFAAALWAGLRFPYSLAPAFAAFALWGFAVALLHTLPSSAARASLPLSRAGRVGHAIVGSIPTLILVGATGAVGALIWRATHLTDVAPIPGDSGRLVALVLLGAALVSWFLAALARPESRDQPDPRLAPLRHLLLAFAIVQFVSAALLFSAVALGFDWLRPLATAIGVLAALLAVEGLLGLAVAFYRPRFLRDRAPPLGASVVLGWFFRRAHPWRDLARSLENTFGLKVGETELFPFLQRVFEPAVLGGLVLLWIGTGITMVPVDSAGVLVRFGRHIIPALSPGLHVHLPAPFASVELVPIRRVQALTLGFDRDLDGPILWAEQHYDGEKSLLVGRGDELLTVSLPIHYRIADPVAFLANTVDAAPALRLLGYRELLALTSSHSSFALMTTDRAEVADTLRTRLQAVCDRHRLGLEILWVGLKDVHPPVPVAPAFQDVVSAEEEKLTIVDRERALATTTLQEAASAAHRLRSEADALLHERTTVAAGEALRFTANAAAAADAPAVFRTRRSFEAAGLGLRDAKRILVVPSAATRADYFLDAPSAQSLLPTLVR